MAIDHILCPLDYLYPWAGERPNEFMARDQQFEVLSKELPRYQEIWEAKGSALLRTASAILNSEFGYETDKMVVFLCPYLPSMEQPRSISMRLFLTSMPENLRWTDDEFVDVVFHEQLHMLVNRLLNWKFTLNLLEKYKEEVILTRMHLHLYAIQKATYEKLQTQEVWRHIVRRNRTFMPSCQRAIQIVEAEGALPLVAELLVGH